MDATIGTQHEALHPLDEMNTDAYEMGEILAEMDELGGFAVVHEEDLLRLEEMEAREERRYTAYLEMAQAAHEGLLT